MKQFLQDYHHSLLNQFLIDVGLGTIVATFLKFISTYLFADVEFAKWLAILMCIDTVFGIITAYRSGTVSSKGFGMIIKKITAYGVVLCMIHILTHFKVQGEKNNLFDWFTQIGYSALVVREAISIIENAGKLAPGLIPAWILKRLKGFDSSGKPQDLTNPSEPEKTA